MSRRNIKLLVAAVVVGTVAASPAMSRPRDVIVTGSSSDLVSRTVDLRGLNLASEGGEHTLNRRVQGAVNKLCLDVVGHHLGYMEPMASCHAQSWSSAQPQVNRAIARARDIAAKGWSAIAPVAIRISIQ